MANIKSQNKRNRQNDKRHERNTTVRSALKTSTKKVQTAVGEGDAETATARQREAARALDKAASKGVLHKRTAARKKSRLAKAVNKTSPRSGLFRGPASQAAIAATSAGITTSPVAPDLSALSASVTCRWIATSSSSEKLPACCR